MSNPRDRIALFFLLALSLLSTGCASRRANRNVPSPGAGTRLYGVTVQGKDSAQAREMTEGLAERFRHRLFVWREGKVIEKTMAAAEPGHLFSVESGPDQSGEWRVELTVFPRQPDRPLQLEIACLEREGTAWARRFGPEEDQFPQTPGEGLLDRLVTRIATLSFERDCSTSRQGFPQE